MGRPSVNSEKDVLDWIIWYWAYFVALFTITSLKAWPSSVSQQTTNKGQCYQSAFRGQVDKLIKVNVNVCLSVWLWGLASKSFGKSALVFLSPSDR